MHVDHEVAVIGGGILGVGAAQACAAAGYSCVVVEQIDWASGTSSRSSKLVHGGLRYLETGQLHLVRESLRERATLPKIAPQLVRPLAFRIPVYRSTRRRAHWLKGFGTLPSAVTTGPRGGRRERLGFSTRDARARMQSSRDCGGC
jgi:glycerol-3-phosphate dehydrogenase